MKKTMIILFGAFLLLVGVLVLAYGSLTHYSPNVNDNGGYVDYIAIFGFAFGFSGAVLLVLYFMLSFKSWARENGAIVHG